MSQKIHDWKNLYKIIVGEKVLRPLMDTAPWSRQLLEDAFNLRGETFDSLFEIKKSTESLLKFWKKYRFSLHDSIGHFITNFGSETLKNHLEQADKDARNLTCEASFLLLAEIYEHMLMDGDIMLEMDADLLRFFPFYVDTSSGNEYFHFGWDCIFTRPGKSENGDFLPILLNGTEFVKTCFSKRGSKIPPSVQDVLNQIAVYQKSITTTRLRSARIMNRQTKEKSPSQAIEEGPKRGTKRSYDDEGEPSTKQDVIQEQKVNRAERAARRSFFTEVKDEVDEVVEENGKVEAVLEPVKAKPVKPKAPRRKALFNAHLNETFDKVCENLKTDKWKEYSCVREIEESHQAALRHKETAEAAALEKSYPRLGGFQFRPAKKAVITAAVPRAVRPTVAVLNSTPPEFRMPTLPRIQPLFNRPPVALPRMIQSTYYYRMSQATGRPYRFAMPSVVLPRFRSVPRVISPVRRIVPRHFIRHIRPGQPPSTSNNYVSHLHSINVYPTTEEPRVMSRFAPAYPQYQTAVYTLSETNGNALDRPPVIPVETMNNNSYSNMFDNNNAEENHLYHADDLSDILCHSDTEEQNAPFSDKATEEEM